MNRINNPLPEPKECDHCNSKYIVFIKNKTKINNNEYRSVWMCRECYAMVLCHADSRTPLGYMTDKSGRELRKVLHNIFDLLWQEKYMTRDEAYDWLALTLLVNREECHIARLSKSELRKAIGLCRKEVEKQKEIKNRRIEKVKTNRIKQYEQLRKHVKRRISKGHKPVRKRGETSFS